MNTIQLEITAMAHGGSGIGRLDGRVVFCPGTLPGDVVIAEITDDSKKSMWRAQAISVVQPSPHRVAHIWPEADMSRPWAFRAGGADYGHIELSHQRSLKTEILKDSLSRFGGLSGALIEGVTVAGVPGDDERGGLGWRTRVTLHANDDGVLGPYAERSHTVVPVTTLPLASEALATSGVLNSTYAGVESVKVLDTSGSGVRLVIDNQKPADIVERVGSQDFHLSDHSFWQVHEQASTILSEALSRAVDLDHLTSDAPNADLYSGVGLLGYALASLTPEALRLSAVESDENALGYVSGNLAGVAHVTPVAGRVDHWLRGHVRDVTAQSKASWALATVVLDPPRSGAKADVIHALAALGVRQIVYVACDPVALSRDAALLVAAGYDMTFLEAWDLFPHTHHMETVATFIRRDARS